MLFTVCVNFVMVDILTNNFVCYWYWWYDIKVRMCNKCFKLIYIVLYYSNYLFD